MHSKTANIDQALPPIAFAMSAQQANCQDPINIDDNGERKTRDVVLPDELKCDDTQDIETESKRAERASL